mgnify:CR=1 FL=1
MKNILITGCSWVQKMYKYNTNYDYEYASFGGRGLWYIQDYLQSRKLNNYDGIVIQLPTPIRNIIQSNDTTERFHNFIEQIKTLGEEPAATELLNEYKQTIIEINKLHDNIVFFLYNVGGYPLRHPYNFSDDADNNMLNFLKSNNLKHLYLSYEGESGYGLAEEECLDEEFWEYYHENNPFNGNSTLKHYWNIIAPKNVIIKDPHPNETADRAALNLIDKYFKTV